MSAADFQSRRRDVGLRASWQMAAVVRVLAKAAVQQGEDNEFDLVVQALSVRMHTLNSVMMAALADNDAETPDELTLRLDEGLDLASPRRAGGAVAAKDGAA